MKNKLIFPDGSPYNPNQRARILDVWSEPPVGIRDVASNDYPNLLVNPTYDGGRILGKDVRYVALRPVEDGKVYELLETDSGDIDYHKFDKNLFMDSMNVEPVESMLEINSKPSRRISLVTRVAPRGKGYGSMAYRAVIDLSLKRLQGTLEGEIWATEALKAEREKMKTHWSIETGWF